MLGKWFWKGITMNIVILGLVSMFTDLSSQIVFPLIPLFLTSLGAGGAIIGIVEWAAETTASFLKVVSWYLSDRSKKRKPLIFLWYSISAITKPLFAFVHTWPLVLFIRVIERIGKWFRDSPRDALIADSTDHSVIGKAYGFQRTLDGLWSVMWAIAAFFLFKRFGGDFQKVFLFAAVPGFIGVFAILFVKEYKMSKKISREWTNPPQPSLVKEGDIVLPFKKWFFWTIKALPWRLKFFILVSALFTLGNFGYAFLLLKTKAVGLGDTNAIFFYILYFGTHTLLSTPLGSLSDKIWRKRILMAWYILFILTALFLIVANTSVLMITWFILYGIFSALTDGEERAFVVDLCPKEYKATALWLFNTAIGLVSLPWAFLMWLLWDTMSPSIAFAYAACVGIVALVMLSFVKEK